MLFRRTLFSLLVALMALASRAVAEVPMQLAFQGKLQDGGVPMTGSTTVTVRLYTQASGGIALWTEADSVVLDGQGVFVTTLGDTTALAPTLFDRGLFAGITVDEAGGGTEDPTRIPLPTVLMVLRSRFADRGPTRVIHVSHNGDDASSGALLLTMAASFTDRSSINRYLLDLGPGRYDLGASSLVLFDYVSVRGAGRDVTTLASTAEIAVDLQAGPSEVSDLTIDATDVGIEVNGADNLLVRVRVDLDHDDAIGTPTGIELVGAQDFRSRDLTLEVDDLNGRPARGVSGGATSGGIEFFRLKVTVNGGPSTGAAEGVNSTLTGGRSFLLHDSEILVTVSTGTAKAVVAASAAARVEVLGSVVAASGGSTNNSFAADGAGSLIRVAHTRITGSKIGDVCGIYKSAGDFGVTTAVPVCP